jgi:hypothetical protein
MAAAGVGRRPVMCERDTAGLRVLMKKAAVALASADVPFALAGGAAAYARGAAPSSHDVDFVVRPGDVPAATAALAAAGLRLAEPPEDWLVKAFDGDHMLDLIFCLAGRPVTTELLKRADVRDVDSIRLPVLSATDLVISWLGSFTEHHADFARTLALVRPIREQVDWPAVRAATSDSAFAAAFLVLVERLHVIKPEEVPSSG